MKNKGQAYEWFISYGWIILVVIMVGVVTWELKPFGCLQNQEETKMNESIMTSGVSCVFFSCYAVEYVDEFYTDKCYAFRNATDEYKIIETVPSAKQKPLILLVPYKDAQRKIYTARCGEIRIADGNTYCLRDNSSCLIVKENICNVINL